MPAPIGNFGQTVHNIKSEYRSGELEAKNLGQLVSQAAKSKDQAVGTVTEADQVLNGNIIESNIDISLQDGENSLSLVYRATIQNLNEALEADFGPNAIQAAVDNGVDTSPQATAERIVSQSTGFFDAYLSQAQENDPELSTEAAFGQFLEVIRGGIERGFNEARSVLSSLSALTENVESDISETEELVAQKLTNYESNYLLNDQTETTPTQEG